MIFLIRKCSVTAYVGCYICGRFWNLWSTRDKATVIADLEVKCSWKCWFKKIVLIIYLQIFC